MIGRPLDAALWLFGTVLWLGVVSGLCLLPIPSGPELDLPHLDKLIHGLVFAAGGFWLTQRKPVWAWPILLFLFALAIEAWQSLTPWRQAEWLDVAADAFGILLGWGAQHVWRQLRPRQWVATA